MKSNKRIFIVTVVGMLVLLGYMIYTLFWGPDRIEVVGKSIPELLESGGLLALIGIPLMVIIIGAAIFPFMRMAFPGEIKNGITATARVMEVWDTGVTVNTNPQVGLLLEVMPKTGSPYQVRTKTIVSRLNAAHVQPGVMAEVKYDPQDQKRVQVLVLHCGKGGERADNAGRLEELKALQEKGLITEEEYQQKRKEILQSL